MREDNQNVCQAVVSSFPTLFTKDFASYKEKKEFLVLVYYILESNHNIFLNSIDSAYLALIDGLFLNQIRQF